MGKFQAETVSWRASSKTSRASWMQQWFDISRKRQTEKLQSSWVFFLELSSPRLFLCCLWRPSLSVSHIWLCYQLHISLLVPKGSTFWYAVICNRGDGQTSLLLLARLQLQGAHIAWIHKESACKGDSCLKILHSKIMDHSVLRKMALLPDVKVVLQRWCSILNLASWSICISYSLLAAKHAWDVHVLISFLRLSRQFYHKWTFWTCW